MAEIDWDAKRAEAGREAAKLTVTDDDGVKRTFEVPAAYSVARSLAYFESVEARKDGEPVWPFLAAALFGPEQVDDALAVFSRDDLIDIGKSRGLLVGE